MTELSFLSELYL